jgi:hypothetical protein
MSEVGQAKQFRIKCHPTHPPIHPPHAPLAWPPVPLRRAGPAASLLSSSLSETASQAGSPSLLDSAPRAAGRFRLLLLLLLLLGARLAATGSGSLSVPSESSSASFAAPAAAPLSLPVCVVLRCGFGCREGGG